MRKLGLGALALVLAGVVYYFTAGAEQITVQMKKEVQKQLVLIQNEGFSVKERHIEENKEHFLLSFDEPQKIAQFLSTQGIQLNVNDAAFLKGLKLGVDVQYLPDTYSAVTLDIYPTVLPEYFRTLATTKEEKKDLKIVEKLLAKKAFLMHVSLNKLASGFKGYIKDIDETLQGDNIVNLNMKNFTFSGDIKNKRISSVKQEIKTLIMQVKNRFNFSVSDIKSDYVLLGKTPYDYSVTYDIASINTDMKTSFDFTAKALHMTSISTVKDGLASGSVAMTVKKLSLTEKTKNFALENLIFESNAEGVNVAAFEQLQQINVNNKSEVNKLLQQLFSHGVTFDISKCSVDNIINDGTKLGGFNIFVKVDLDKSIDISAIESNPMSLLSSVDANLNLMFSKELFSIIAQQPKAMMALMLFQPKDVKGKKSYMLELKDGKLLVNGSPVF